MHKVIAYRKRADEYRRRASQATNAQEREAEERMAAAWDLLAKAAEGGRYPTGSVVYVQIN